MNGLKMAYLDDVKDGLEEQDLHLYRKEIQISHVSKGLQATGDIVSYLFDFVYDKIKNDDFENEPIIDEDRIEDSMDWINDNTDYRIKWEWEQEA